MNCVECGSERMTTKRETIKYDAIGVPVTLQGVEVRRCAGCGAYEIVIPQVEGLHRALADRIIRKASRLAPREVVFLRKYLGWSGADFARAWGPRRRPCPAGSTARRGWDPSPIGTCGYWWRTKHLWTTIRATS